MQITPPESLSNWILCFHVSMLEQDTLVWVRLIAHNGAHVTSIILQVTHMRLSISAEVRLDVETIIDTGAR